MNIKLLAVGKTDNPALQQLIDMYEKRLSYYINFELQLLPDIKNSKSLSEEQQKAKEGELILGNVASSHHLILLDERGKEFTSVKENECRHQAAHLCDWGTLWFFKRSIRPC